MTRLEMQSYARLGRSLSWASCYQNLSRRIGTYVFHFYLCLRFQSAAETFPLDIQEEEILILR